MSGENVNAVSGKSPVAYRGVPFDSPEACLAYWEIPYKPLDEPRDWYKFRENYYANMETAYKCNKNLPANGRMVAGQSVFTRASDMVGHSALFARMSRADREKILGGMNALFASSLYNDYRGPAYAALGGGVGFVVTYGAELLHDWGRPFTLIKIPAFTGVALLGAAVCSGAAWLIGRPSSQAPDLEVIERLSKQGNN